MAPQHQPAREQLHNLVGFGVPFEHTAKQGILFLGYGKVEDVAVERPLCRSGSHVLHFGPGSVQYDTLQFAYFAVYVQT